MNQVKVGDRLLVRPPLLALGHGGYYHAQVIDIKEGLLGKEYLCRWGVNSDFMGHYETIGYIPHRRVIKID